MANSSGAVAANIIHRLESGDSLPHIKRDMLLSTGALRIAVMDSPCLDAALRTHVAYGGNIATALSQGLIDRPWLHVFLTALRDDPNATIMFACRAAKVSRQMVYSVRDRYPTSWFVVEWERIMQARQAMHLPTASDHTVSVSDREATDQLVQLIACGVPVQRACDLVGIAYQRSMQRRQRDGAFRTSWQQALQHGRLVRRSHRFLPQGIVYMATTGKDIASFLEQHGIEQEAWVSATQAFPLAQDWIDSRDA